MKPLTKTFNIYFQGKRTSIQLSYYLFDLFLNVYELEEDNKKLIIKTITSILEDLDPIDFTVLTKKQLLENKILQKALIKIRNLEYKKMFND